MDLHKPLVGEVGLDDRLGPIAARHHEFVRVDADQQPECLELGDHLLACSITVQTSKARRRVVIDGRVIGKDIDEREGVALTDRVVIEVVSRRDLDATRAEGRVDIVVRDDRNAALGQWQQKVLADKAAVAVIAGVDRHRDIAEHGFRPGGGDHQMAATIGKWVAQMPQEAVFLFGHHFQVGYSGMQHRVPVDQALAAVDEPLTI